LIDVKGTLYSTTFYGGAYGRKSGNGTVFSVTGAGAEHVLHSFGGRPDGIHPVGGLINLKATLYGTTVDRGAHGDSLGYGTVFSISTAGSEQVLYSFDGRSDGSHPEASLTKVRGRLYGSTQFGGTYADGTIFALTP
jgi:uncharacterized repeat protein (TIGR03803 family)